MTCSERRRERSVAAALVGVPALLAVAGVLLAVATTPAWADVSVTVTANTTKAFSILPADAPSGVEVTLVSGPSHGSLSTPACAGGSCTYTPAAGYVGSDAFTAVEST